MNVSVIVKVHGVKSAFRSLQIKQQQHTHKQTTKANKYIKPNDQEDIVTVGSIIQPHLY